MILDEYEERSEAEARIDRKISREQDALHFTECMPRQRKVQGETCEREREQKLTEG